MRFDWRTLYCPAMIASYLSILIVVTGWVPPRVISTPFVLLGNVTVPAALLIIGSSIVMTVKGGPTLFGLPAFGFLGFFGAVVCGLWLVRAIWRSSHHRDDD